MDMGHGRISDSCMSPDGTRIVTCGADETIRVYRVFGEQVRMEEDRDTLWAQNIIR
jgi:cell division cycle protein 20 (cofactor of APC complex)